MSMTSEMKDQFKRKMAEQLRQNHMAAEQKEEEEKKEVEELFAKVADPVAGDNQKMFSDLFFDPKGIGPDFPVDTFHHMHNDWPDWVKECIPAKDPHYQWNKESVYAFLVADDEHTFLVGQPGSGKTSLPEQVAAVTGRPVFKQAFSADLEADEWIMAKEIDDKGTHWYVLPFVKAMSFPFYCNLDEFNRLRRGGRLLMNQTLNEGGAMQLRDGREVVPHPQWRAIATDNTRGMGDGLDKFDGDIADISTTDRFGQMIEVPYLPVKQQTSLLMLSYPDMSEKLAKQIVLFGEKISQGYKTGALPLPWTPRRMKKAGKLAMRYRNPTKGIQNAYYNFLAEDDHRKACNQALKDVGIAGKFGEFE